MKIESSNVIMQSNLEAETKHSSSVVKFELFHGLSELKENAYKAHVATELLLSTDFSSQNTKALYAYDNQMGAQDRCKKQVIENIMGMFFTKDQDIFTYPVKNSDMEEKLQDSAMIIETTEEYYQKQTIDFDTFLEIRTPTEHYTMDLEISFTQELYEAHHMELKLGNSAFLDPLVINYDDDINPFDNLSSLKFEFDLNNDGEDDLIPLLKKGAGFLAYDKNENGKIDNGSELFGPNTNDGFGELSQHDSDGNNWIDENDAIFNKLKVWQINEEGENQLVSLLDLNIGAIYLGEVQSGFTYQNSIEKVDALQKSNGVYVKNDGSGARMINALDIALQTNS